MTKKTNAVEIFSFNELLDSNKKKLQDLQPTIYKELVESDPAITLLEIAAYIEGLLRNRINKSIEAVMLDYATTTDLENLGILFGLKRKTIIEADDTVNPAIEAVYETDDAFRKRIKEAPKGFSVAGPRSAYIYYGKDASNLVKDISVVSPWPMEIEIHVLSYIGSGAATQELINIVRNKLNSDEIRPLGDKITVKSALIHTYSIRLEIIFNNEQIIEKEKTMLEIKNNIIEYTSKEHKLFGMVTLSGINASAFVDGVKDVKIISPASNAVGTHGSAPYCNSITIEAKNRSDTE